jgi:hypothetical protein
MAGGRQIVDGPAFSTLPYSLWGAIQHPVPDGPHWQNGITWQDFCPQVPDTMYDECLTVTGTGGAPPAFPTLPVGGNVSSINRGATPFTVYAEFDCSPIGLDASGDRATAESALAKLESYAVERAFWTGQAGSQSVVWPHLAANAQFLDTNQIVLQNVESQLSACYGGRGVIHIPRLALPTFVAWQLVHDEGGQLYTTAGNLVVPGGGYPGTSPAGAAPAAGQSWIYATGAVFGYRSDVVIRRMPENFDRIENTVRAIAYRTYVIGYECCLIAAQIATGVPASPTV